MNILIKKSYTGVNTFISYTNIPYLLRPPRTRIPPALTKFFIPTTIIKYSHNHGPSLAFLRTGKSI